MINVSNDLIKLAKRIIYAELSKIHPNFDKLVRAYDQGNYAYGVVFNDTKRIKKRPDRASARKISDLKEALQNAHAEEITDAQIKPDYLKLTYKDDSGRYFTYVFTEKPFEEVFNLPAPPKSPDIIADEIADKLRQAGLHSLGKRYGKAGVQWGTPEGARRIAIGRRDLVLNYLLVENSGKSSRWNMQEIVYLKDVTDKLIDEWVRWVKVGPTMRQVRQKAREEGRAYGN